MTGSADPDAAAARRAFESDAGLVVIEAPAGAGKTHLAAEATVASASRLSEGREALLLAHTNAAVTEFARRVGRDSRVRTSTLDAFAMGLLAVHTVGAGVPSPFRPDPVDAAAWFGRLAPLAVALIRGSPTIARQVALHHPLIVLDEHQDARVSQHEFVRLLAAQGARVRILGDPMQAIYNFDSDPLVTWGDVLAGADSIHRLRGRPRWDATPRLGDWLATARATLERGAAISLDDSPPEIRCRVIEAQGDIHGRLRRFGPGLARALNPAVRGLRGTVAVLVRYNATVFGIRGATGRTYHVDEGHDLALARRALGDMSSVAGDVPASIEVALALLQETCTGLTAALSADVRASFASGRLTLGRRTRCADLCNALSPLIENPDTKGLGAAMRRVLRERPAAVHVDLRETLEAIADCDDASADAADSVVTSHIRRLRMHPSAAHSILTIHRAKGRSFDHVIVAICGETPFPDTLEGRALLYTAMTRATRSVTFLLPATGRSPLVQFSSAGQGALGVSPPRSRAAVGRRRG